MPKVSRVAGSTGHILSIFAQDTSKTDGSGLTGLTNASSGLTCYYKRNVGSGAVAVTLDAITTLGTYGTYASGHGGFAEVDSVHMPGVYEFQPPDAAYAAGAKSVLFMFRGAANMAPVPAEIEVTAVDNQSTAFNLSLAKGTNLTGLNDIAASSIVSNGAITTASGAVSNVTTVGTLTANADKTGYTASTVTDKTGYSLAGTQSFNNTGQTTKLAATLASTDVTGNLPANLTQWLGVAPLALSSQFVQATAAFTLGTDAISAAAVSAGAVTKIQAGLATPTNITAGTITTVTTTTNLTNAPGSGDFTAAMKTSLNAATPTVTVGPVTLAASQPSYPPAKAGDAMTLTTAYDAAKIAAPAGTALSTANWTTARAGYLDNLSAGAVALASQIPAGFTTATFASPGVFATAALANAPTNSGGSGSDTPGTTTLLARIPAALTVTSGRVVSDLGAIAGTPIGSSGIYTMRASSTSTAVHFDAADPIANAADGAINRYIDIVGGTGIRAGSVPIAAISGASGSADGSSTVDLTGFDSTTKYQWGDPVVGGGSSGPVTLSATGLDAVMVEPGYTAKAALKVMLAAAGSPVTGCGTGTVLVGGMPAPTTGSATKVTATMTNVAPDAAGNPTAVDRTSTAVVLSTT